MIRVDPRLLALAALTLSACGDGRTQNGGAGAEPKAAVSTTSPVADRTYEADEADIRAHFAANPLDMDLVRQYDASLKAWDNQAAACTTDPCRATLEKERAAAAAFGAGKPARIEGLPFTSGLFNRTEEGFSGPLRLVPLAPEGVLVVADLSFKGQPACGLKGLMTPRAEGGWTITSLEKDAPELVVVAKGPDELVLSFADPDHQPWQADYCSVGVSVDGQYRLARG